MTDPFTWKVGWVVFDAVSMAPLLFQIVDDNPDLQPEDHVLDRCALIFETEKAGLAAVEKLFGANPKYPDRFPVRPMPRDVPDCLSELQERLDLQAFSDGTTVWRVRSVQ